VDTWAQVASVLDGDTLLLTDQRRVRLIGVNTPERGHGERPAEPFGEAAQRSLERQAGGAGRVGLRYDQEREDRHGRTLAHAFLPDGTNLQRSLLEAGLAAAVVVPPNDWAWECYRGAESKAREATRGIWGHARFRPVESGALPRRARGFWVVRGPVEQVREGAGDWWLDLPGRVTLRLPTGAVDRFVELVPPSLLGRRVEARGWLRGGGARGRHLEVGHPGVLQVLD
jgi:endonuclease YncB( thermonuclease family)